MIRHSVAHNNYEHYLSGTVGKPSSRVLEELKSEVVWVPRNTRISKDYKHVHDLD